MTRKQELLRLMDLQRQAYVLRLKGLENNGPA